LRERATVASQFAWTRIECVDRAEIAARMGRGWADNELMSVVQECARAEAVIQRARSLFAATAVPPVDSAVDLISASQATAAAAQRTVDDSGVLITRHRAFATNSAATLSGASQTDTSLRTYAATAATLTQIGAQRIDAIAAQTRATAQAAAAAPSAQSLAAQKAILTALRSQVAAARDVVTATTTQASELAGQIRALQYPLDRPGPTAPGDVPSHADNSVASPLLGTPLPDGPIVWCIRPPGVFGDFRCSVLYPDLSVGTYWSPTDDSGGSAP
jgi:hypothetical protein